MTPHGVRVSQINGADLPAPVDVYGWRWDAAVGEKPSKTVFNIVDREWPKHRVQDSGVGVFRARDQHGSWYVWVVDFRVGLWQKSALIRKVAAETVDPDPQTAVMLVLRHIRHIVEGGPGDVSQRAHYGLGALLGPGGELHPFVGGDQ